MQGRVRRLARVPTTPLRHAATAGSCSGALGTHRIWWASEAPDERTAFSHLPPWVAERTVAERVGEVKIPREPPPAKGGGADRSYLRFSV